MPCPVDRWQVKATIDDLLKPALAGMVLDLDVGEGGDARPLPQLQSLGGKLVMR